jgi:hypothetical protein
VKKIPEVKLPEAKLILTYFWMYWLKGEWCHALSIAKLTSPEMAQDWLLERLAMDPTQKKMKWVLCVAKTSVSHEVVSYRERGAK